MIEFVSYDGSYPNLCSGTLVIRYDGTEYSFNLVSGGRVWFDEHWSEHVEDGPWSVGDAPDRFPAELIPAVEKIANEHVQLGCCGGCV